uniref:Capsid protein n=1 Tax=Cressdnaviricota sp. TaxID=2748378 RepID=A0A6M3YP39_9VIRU|nr:MAG: capsid protein [Cressdnaviricota sp.]
MYGKRRYSKKSASSRAGGATRMRRNSTYKKVGSAYTKSRSLVGQRLARREIKYDDDYYSLQRWTKNFASVSTNAPGFVNWVLGGMITKSSSDVAVVVGASGGMVPVQTYAPNCLTNIESGTTAYNRIGNLVQPRFITIKGVLNAACTNNPGDGETTFRSETGSNPVAMVSRYMRTSVRIIVLRDKSMNEKGYVEYNDVFERPSVEGAENPYLWNRKIDSIGRYQILKTMEYDLDQDDPQKTFTYTIPLNGVAIRFNGAATSKAVLLGPSNNPLMVSGGSTPVAGSSIWMDLASSSDAQSMTNGVYLLAVAHCGFSASSNTENFLSPALTFSSRLTFED